MSLKLLATLSPNQRIQIIKYRFESQLSKEVVFSTCHR